MDTTTRSRSGHRAPGRTAADRHRPPTPAQDPHPLVVEPLTARELEVLGHLSLLLSTEEIASEMFVSVNTVRTHVRSVLRKMSATRRNEAVRRAWELQLLPRRADLAPAARAGAPADAARALPPRAPGTSGRGS